MEHLRLSDRYEIKILLDKKYSFRQIANTLDRSVSTISDEINRNKKMNGTYDPLLAQQKAYVRRRNASFKGKKIVRYDNLREFVEKHIVEGYTPEAIAGRLKNQEKNIPYVGKDTIYKFQQSPYGKLLGVNKEKEEKKI